MKLTNKHFICVEPFSILTNVVTSFNRLTDLKVHFIGQGPSFCWTLLLTNLAGDWVGKYRVLQYGPGLGSNLNTVWFQTHVTIQEKQFYDKNQLVKHNKESSKGQISTHLHTYTPTLEKKKHNLEGNKSQPEEKKMQDETGILGS